MSEGRLTRDDLNPNVLESLRGPKGEPGQQGPPGEQGLPGKDAEITMASETILGGVKVDGETITIDGNGVIRGSSTVDTSALATKEEFNTHAANSTLHVNYGVATGADYLKSVTIAGVTEYVDGMAISFKMQDSTTSTSSSQLNINGLGARVIRRSNGTNYLANLFKANGIYTVRYNASNSSFILQGEGGEYGNATAPQVLVGRTFGTESGIVTGTMPNKSGQTTTGVQISSSSTIIDLVPAAGYYDGDSSSRVRITNANFTPANIKKNINMFGVIGTLGEKYATGQAYSTTGGAEYIYISNLGFRPRVVIAKVANMSDKNRYAAIYALSPTVFGDLDFRMADNGTVYANSGTTYTNANTFRLQVDSINSRLYNWIAFGSNDLAN